MKWSKAFIPTLKESPADAEAISHKLMIRAGLIRKLGAGTYTYLPLGLKVLRKVENIIREEMNSAGAQELLMPAIHPKELWDRTGRFDLMKDILITYKDRHGKIGLLGATHEEVITDLAARELRSYRDLPKILYQIQTKFRDEPRPQFGVLRSKEFIMKDAYSFDADAEGLNKNYKLMYDAYCRIFDRCALKFTAVEADSGFMGGDVSHEFTMPSKSGEDIEVAHTFKLGTKYSKDLNAAFLDKDGKEKLCIMGCYGIGVNRIMAAAIEQNNDKDGIIWPRSISPYEVVVIPINILEKDLRSASEKIYNSLQDEGFEVLFDDRDERAGIKFKDADLIGIPLRLVVSEKHLKNGQIEAKLRNSKTATLLNEKDLLKEIKTLLGHT